MYIIAEAISSGLEQDCVVWSLALVQASYARPRSCQLELYLKHQIFF